MTTKRYNFKLVMLGACGVGKSSIALKLTKDCFDEYSPSTMGASFHIKEVRLDDCIVKFEIWDTAGQEEYDRLRPLSYANANVFLLCFSVISPVSFENVTAKVNN